MNFFLTKGKDLRSRSQKPKIKKINLSLLLVQELLSPLLHFQTSKLSNDVLAFEDSLQVDKALQNEL